MDRKGNTILFFVNIWLKIVFIPRIPAPQNTFFTF